MDELLEIFDKFIWIRVNSRVWPDTSCAGSTLLLLSRQQLLDLV